MERTYGQIVVEMLKYVEFDYQDLNVVIGPATSSTYEINDDIKRNLKHCLLILTNILKHEILIDMVLI